MAASAAGTAADPRLSGGHDKTTLVATWLETCDRFSAWLSLDEEEDHLPLILAYLLPDIRVLISDVSDETLAVVKQGNPL